MEIKPAVRILIGVLIIPFTWFMVNAMPQFWKALYIAGLFVRSFFGLS